MLNNTEFIKAISNESPKVAFKLVFDDEVISSDDLLVEASLEFICNSFIGQLPSWKLTAGWLVEGDAKNYENRTLNVFVGAYPRELGKYSDNPIWAPMGVYTIAVGQQKTDAVNPRIDIVAYDKAVLLDKRHVPLDFGTAGLTGLQIRTLICERNGLTFTPGVLKFDSKVFNSLNLGAGQAITDREVLKQYLTLNMAYCSVDRNGSLKVINIMGNPTAATLSNFDYPDLKIEETFGPINSLIYSNKATGDDRAYQSIESKDNDSISTNGKNSLEFQDNIFIDSYSLEEKQIVLNDLLSSINGYSYTPFEMELFARPDLDVGDVIKLVDMKGNEYLSPVTSMKIMYNGGLMGSLSTKKVPQNLPQKEIPNIFDRVTNAEISVDRLNNKITLEVKDIKQEIKEIETTPGPKGDPGVSIVSTLIEYQIHDNGTQAPTGTWSQMIPTVPKNMYLWTRSNFAMSDGSSVAPAYSVSYQASDGSDGVGISGVDIAYQTSTQGKTPPTGNWVTVMPAPVNGSWLWIRTITSYSDNTESFTFQNVYYAKDGAAGPKGDKGAQGIPGSKGADGIQYYTWLKFSDTPQTGMSDSPEGKRYMGLAMNQTSPIMSTKHEDYVWTDTQGLQGQQGIPGKPGIDGKPTFAWIKYADTPLTGMSDLSAGKIYIGMAFNKTTATESAVYEDYQWSLMPQNFVIGGRNLLLKSNVSVENSAYNISKYDLTDTLVVGEEVTIQVKGQLGSDRTSFRGYNSGGSFVVVTLNPSDRNSKGIYTKTFKWVIGTSLNTFLQMYQFTSSGTSSSTIEWIKLERGNVATDYTIAPEDIEKDMNDKFQGVYDTEHTLRAGIQMLNDQILSEVKERTLMGDRLLSEVSAIIEHESRKWELVFTELENGIIGSDDAIRELKTYFRFDINGAIIGKSGSPVEFYQTNAEIGFRENGQTIARWAKGTMEVDHLVATISIVIGVHVFEKYNSPHVGMTTTLKSVIS